MAAETVVAHVPQDLTNSEFPRDAEGRVYHLGLKQGEVANRCLFVGDPHRAKIIKDLFDDPSTVFSRASTRGFTCYTGKYNGTPLSVLATGMGYPMMDFAVRELRAIVEGPMVIVRLGSCGSPHADCVVGSTVIADKCIRVDQNVEAVWEADEGAPHAADKYYTISKPVEADQQLTELLRNSIVKHLPETSPIFVGTTASCDSYYSSQGRVDPAFDDRSETLVDFLCAKHDVSAIEMETFHLMHLAKISRGTIVAAGAAFVMAQRASNKMLHNAVKEKLEKLLGTACLDCLISYPIDPKVQMTNGVWNQ